MENEEESSEKSSGDVPENGSSFHCRMWMERMGWNHSHLSEEDKTEEKMEKKEVTL